MLLLLELSGCINEEIENKIDGYDLTIAYGQDVFTGFYPWIGFINQQTLIINANVFNSLVEFDEEYQIIPTLAESWNNPNNLTWRFFLRRGVTFHNGDIFSADDVKYSIDRITGDMNDTLYSYLTMIQDVIVVDNFTVDIVTFAPYPLLLNKLVYAFIIPKQNTEEISNNTPIGTGAYKFSEYVEDEYLVLDRFEGYWGEKPAVQKVTFQFFNNYKDRLNNLLGGHADIIVAAENTAWSETTWKTRR